MITRLIVSICTLAISHQATAQTSDNNNAYAITSHARGLREWTEVKLIDLNSGEVVSNVFENSKKDYHLFDGRSSKPITLTAGADSSAENDKRPFSGLSAACAFDSRNNRLYYVPMFINQLRYIDLSSKEPSVYLFEDQPFIASADMQVEANHITRMVIGADGNGYALNNDGSHLIKFTTGETPIVTDLGSLQDAATNTDVLISDANTSWGGDMVADASGNLYLITAGNHVFRIDVQMRSAQHIAKIKNLPEGFTTNGAVVDKRGALILSSANYLPSYFSVDPSNWEAAAVASNGAVFNTSDLANNHYLFQTELATVKAVETNKQITIYPNPVVSDFFRVSFNNQPSGKYNIQLLDISGRILNDKALYLSGAGQTSEMKVGRSLARGPYTVKVLNHEKKEVFLKKIILQ